MVLNESMDTLTMLGPNPLELISNSVNNTLTPLLGIFKAVGIAALVYIYIILDCKGFF